VLLTDDDHPDAGLPGARPSANGSPATAMTLSPLAVQVNAWTNSGGTAHLRALSADSQSVAAASKSGDLAALKEACARFARDTLAATAYQDFPDPEAQRYWAKALELDVRSTKACADASAIDDVYMTISANLARQSTAQLELMSARIDEIFSSR
jgi:hypothetical protein